MPRHVMQFGLLLLLLAGPSLFAPASAAAQVQAEPATDARVLSQRTLELISKIESVDTLTPGFVTGVLGVPMTTDGDGGAFEGAVMVTPTWAYGLRLYPLPADSSDMYLRIQFNDQTDEGQSMTPVCGVDLNAYVAALRGVGFRVEPSYSGRYGQQAGWRLAHDGRRLSGSIDAGRETDGRGGTEGEAAHLCMQMIMLTSY